MAMRAMQLCFIGDSFVAGVGDEQALGWVGRVMSTVHSRSVDRSGYNLGVRRDTSGDIRARWEREVNARLKLDVPLKLCFSFGANDCTDDGHGRPHIPIADVISNTESVLIAAVKMTSVMMIGPLPIRDDVAADTRIAELDQELGTVCRALGVPYLTVFDEMSGCQVWTQGAARGDGTHPNAAGYQTLALHVLEWPAFQH
ncbi:MAG: hypothetical protein CBC34_010115 [Hyphomicrobiaceae bacterium TMED74]|nr:hypothetical protein [Filomicrobium sp.]RPG41437.1 MAG: hypothetical protein CBC34_010115 [Hyphomicrobiaceae bacterium TMED74]